MTSTDEIPKVDDIYRNWYLDYASYVILDRAIPHIKDGLKPVQRRIMHSLKEMDDGRLNKIANVTGHCMRYHPHGDSSIYGAIVGLGQKKFLIDTQGNWGNIFTGDPAAAARYIEGRLSSLAKKVSFNNRLTEFVPSYDGRGEEPVTLPMKFPLLLFQGAEGIAVGLACSILPHNFVELCDGAIAHLEGREFIIYPDFPTGGVADVRGYNDGMRGGRVKVRARIDLDGTNKLIIRDLPYGVVGEKLMQSIESAVEKNKIRIDKITNLIAKEVRIDIVLPSGTDQEMARDALYAFTSCEVSLATNACVIQDDKPRFLGVSDILRFNADQTKALIKRELELEMEDLKEDWHRKMLERLFIENKVYEGYTDSKRLSWEDVLAYTTEEMNKYRTKVQRDISEEDIIRLTEIRMKRLTRFDTSAADKAMAANEAEQARVIADLQNIVPITVEYFQALKKSFTVETVRGISYSRERRTQLEEFGSVQASAVAAANVKLYINREEGFLGHSMKKDELLCDCSDIDDVLAIGRDGWMKVSRITPKTFFGRDILFGGIWRKGDTRVFNLIYQNKESGHIYAKRFLAGSITRDKSYELVKSTGSQVLYLSARDTAEEVPPKVNIHLVKVAGVRKTEFEYNFADLAVKGRASGGNRLSKYTVSKIEEI